MVAMNPTSGSLANGDVLAPCLSYADGCLGKKKTQPARPIFGEHCGSLDNRSFFVRSPSLRAAQRVASSVLLRGEVKFPFRT